MVTDSDVVGFFLVFIAADFVQALVVSVFRAPAVFEDGPGGF